MHVGFAMNICFAAIGFGIGGVNAIFACFNLVLAVLCWCWWYEEENSKK